MSPEDQLLSAPHASVAMRASLAHLLDEELDFKPWPDGVLQWISAAEAELDKALKHGDFEHIITRALLDELRATPRAIQALNSTRGAPPRRAYRNRLVALAVELRIQMGRPATKSYEEVADKWGFESTDTVRRNIYAPRRHLLGAFVGFARTRGDLTDDFRSKTLAEFLEHLERACEIEPDKCSPDAAKAEIAWEVENK